MVLTRGHCQVLDKDGMLGPLDRTQHEVTLTVKTAQAQRTGVPTKPHGPAIDLLSLD